MQKMSFEQLAIQVKTKREEKNWTQDQLGEKTKINRQMIGRIEAGSYLPSLPQLNCLLNELQIDFDQILEKEEHEDVFVAFLGDAKTPEEQEGFERMVSMMLCLRKHLRLKEASSWKLG